ncbi:uncharacterized protein [Spinacia oleracea]|uniref:DUF4371 domain-containing protein n=1 Tax=Spinacia oleracea TaxID=3562 RepID=A0ABM3R8T1_SPIOL|nr:uncharacterized protein LOC110803396 [Spinacia oleracea]
MDPEKHIDKASINQLPAEIKKNRLQLEVSVFVVKCKYVRDVTMGNAPQIVLYTSPDIQKEILLIYSRVREVIRKEIEYFSKHNLIIQNVRGQGYDGASNMRAEWNGLQALFLNDCPYAYYIHCFAHMLQLALVAASRDVVTVHHFFSKVTFIVNIVTSSAKRHDQLQAAHVVELERLMELDELVTGRGLNQVGTVKRAGDTRWGSHLNSLRSLVTIYRATRSVLQIIITEGKGTQKGEADKAYDDITSFECVDDLHIMVELLAMTNDLCLALQRKSQDILNAMNLVSKTKILIQNFREDGCMGSFARTC